MASTLKAVRNGAVGFIVWLDALVGGPPSGNGQRELSMRLQSPKEILLTWPRRQTFLSPAFRHPFQCRQPQVVASVHEALVSLAQMRGVLAYPDFIGDDPAAIAGRRQKPGMVEARGGAGRVAIPTDSRVGNKLVALLSIGSPNVVQRNTLPCLSTVPPITWTAFAFGYHSGHLVASMMCCQTRSQGAWMTSSLCANRSAFAGSNPVGQ